MQSGTRVEKIDKPVKLDTADKQLSRKRKAERKKRTKMNRKRVKGVQAAIYAGNARVIPHE